MSMQPVHCGPASLFSSVIILASADSGQPFSAAGSPPSKVMTISSAATPLAGSLV